MSKINSLLKKNDKHLIGHDEWCSLFDLQIPAIKAKVDTGAKTSALHAFNITTKKRNGISYVFFDMHPLQANSKIIVHCRSPIVDRRYVMSSNGCKEHRYVISTNIKIGDFEWPIEVTLSNRDPLRYRMLLGREALGHRFVIDPSLSCNQGRLDKKTVKGFYKDPS